MFVATTAATQTMLAAAVEGKKGAERHLPEV